MRISDWSSDVCSSDLLARPGLKRLTTVGSGPIRGLKSEPGSFDGDLFVASYDSLYRMDNDLTSTSIYNGLYNPEKGFVKMAITAQIGTTPEYCFIADGRKIGSASCRERVCQYV